MAKIFCCSLEMKVERIGVSQIEYDNEHMPYAIYSADILYCSVCGHKIRKTANEPFIRRHDKNFNSRVSALLKT